MPFRDVTLPDGSTVRARVSDQAIEDWLATRDVVRKQYGFDRPPDWDTGPQRGWLPHVNDPAERARFEKLTFGGDRVMDLARDRAHLVAEGPAIVWTWETSAIVSKLIVSWRGDGSFRVKWRAFATTNVSGLADAGQYLVDREWLIPGEIDIVRVGDWIEQKLVEIDAVANVAYRRGEPLSSTSQLVVPRIDDTDGSEPAGAEAAADVAAEFGWAEWAEPFLGPEPAERDAVFGMTGEQWRRLAEATDG